ncbi:ABC transporter permease [Microaerobacter geothermalis]|uniref:methionine ABC transporter permease n=1 Tax=Microaerobacter geothermalis TaxID=674972 RepID=UPI001F390F99|nr:methionine ABC transporter permease [Microaerobacter geothermalis]MCF6092377.1 ABC transporter permease [Microaerobacter geothermalis]
MEWITGYFQNVMTNWDGVLLATGETLYMVIVSLFFASLLGIPLGVLLVITSPGYMVPIKWLNSILGTVVNIFRSVPYIVLILWVIPISRMLIGTSIGPTAALFSLILGSAPFLARLVETSIREVDKGVIEAAQSMGANNWQIIRKVLIPEALPAIISSITVTSVGLVGYSAFAGIIGAGGLGSMAYNLGYNSFQGDILLVTTILLVLIVQLFQSIGDWLSRLVDKR